LNGTTTRVDLASNGSEAPSGSFTFMPSISDDGRYVAFVTTAQLVPEDSVTNSSDVYVRDTLLGTTTRVSIGNGVNGVEANATTNDAEISGNGHFVAFASFANNLFVNDTNQAFDIFVRNMLANTTAYVSVAADGTQANGDSRAPSISTDGTKI